MGSSSTVAAEKTEEELRKEIDDDELHRQQREITERLRDPRPRNLAANGGRQRGFVRPAERTEDQPPAKRRLSSAVVKVEDVEITEGASEAAIDAEKRDSASGIVDDAYANSNASQGEKNPSNCPQRAGNQRPSRMDFEIPPAEHAPRDEDPSLVNKNKRMLGQLFGTLEMTRGFGRAIGKALFSRSNRSSSESRDNEEDEEPTRVPVPELGSNDDDLNANESTEGGEDDSTNEEAEDLANHDPPRTQQPIFTWEGVLMPSNKVSRIIRNIMSRHMELGGYTWAKVSRERKDEWWEIFQRDVTWNREKEDAAHIRDLFHQRASQRYSDLLNNWKRLNRAKGVVPPWDDRVWNALKTYWDRPEVKAKSEQCRKNRMSKVSKHKGGSKGAAEYAYEYYKKHGRLPSAWDLVKHFHKKKGGGYTYDQMATTIRAVEEQLANELPQEVDEEERERRASQLYTQEVPYDHGKYRGLGQMKNMGRVQSGPGGTSRGTSIGGYSQIDVERLLAQEREKERQEREEMNKKFQEELNRQTQLLHQMQNQMTQFFQRWLGTGFPQQGGVTPQQGWQGDFSEQGRQSGFPQQGGIVTPQQGWQGGFPQHGGVTPQQGWQAGIYSQQIGGYSPHVSLPGSFVPPVAQIRAPAGPSASTTRARRRSVDTSVDSTAPAGPT